PSVLIDTLRLIDIEVLESYELAGVNDAHRFAMIALGHKGTDKVSKINIIDWDSKRNQFCFRYYYIGKRPEVDIVVCGLNKPIKPVSDKVRIHTFMGKTLVYEYIGWYEWPGNGLLSFYINGEYVDYPIRLRSKESTQNRLTPKKPNVKSLPIPVR